MHLPNGWAKIAAKHNVSQKISQSPNFEKANELALKVEEKNKQRQASRGSQMSI